MYPRLVCTVLLTVLATAGPAWSQEKFTIKLAKLKQGDVIVEEKTDKASNLANIVDNDGKVVKELENKKTTSNYAFRETILEKAAGARDATKLKRHYLKAEDTTNGTTVVQPYQGKTVLIEKKDGKYRFFIEGGDELTGKDADKLNKSFNEKNKELPEVNDFVAPKNPVAVGESWKLDMEVLGKGFGFELDQTASKGSGKLVKAYRKNGRQFGVLQIDLHFEIKSLNSNKMPLKAEPGSKMTFNVLMDVCIDGSADLGTSTGKIAANFRVRVPDQPQLLYAAVANGEFVEHHKAPAK